jgi:hypothetical protein
MAFLVAGPIAAMRRRWESGAKARDFLCAERGPEGPLFHVNSGHVDSDHVDAGHVDFGQVDSVPVDLRIAFSIRAHMASTPFTLVKMSQS